MNNLSWPATILIGILLGLIAVAAERTAESREPATASSPGATAAPAADGGSGGGSSGSGGGSSGDDDGADTDDAETSPDTGGTAVEATVTLTFDDGPHPVHTPQVLALLDEHDVTAVFCVVGQRVREHPELVQRIVDGGHALCNHTDTHDEKLAERDRDGIERQITAADEAIDAAVDGDAEVRYFRQPNTHVRPELAPVLADHELQPLDWTVDPRDWSRPGAVPIVQRVLDQLHPGAVILLHDGGGDRSQTVAALEQILPGLAAGGYRYVLPEGS